MRILIDADGCPVVDLTINLAQKANVECIILCDTSHIFNKENAKTITVSKGADSVDFALVNMLCENDIVVTQDYGLAAMCLAKKGVPLSQDGMLYTSDNIESLLMQRHMAKKVRMAGGRLKGAPKRNAAQNDAFEKSLCALLNI